MVIEQIEAHIHYRHKPDEVAGLSMAIIPMAEYIAAVASPSDKARMKQILNCKYFRAYTAKSTVKMLLAACKYAKFHLGDYFPLMRAGILDNALALEEAATDYQALFEQLKNEAVPTN